MTLKGGYMKYIIYKITNLKNSKFYIGITSYSLRHRLNGHFRKSRFNPTSNLHKAIAKYGEENFKIDYIYSFDEEDKKKAYALEQEYINSFNSIKNGYNMDLGYGWNIHDKRGQNNPMYGKISGNAQKVSINGIVYNSLSDAGKQLNKNRATILRWIKSDKHPNCYKLKRTIQN